MSISGEYRLRSRKNLFFLLLGLLIALISFLFDVAAGPVNISIFEVVEVLFQDKNISPQAEVIIWSLRLPMATMALLVGASLGIAGAGMQTILANPLASPYTLGVSAGAGFGASLAIVVGISSFEFLGSFLIPFSAFIFALLASFFIYVISKTMNFSSETMILSGIGLMFLFQALQALMQYNASPEALQNIVFWTMGNLGKANWNNILIILIIFILIFPLILKESWKLTALKLGDDHALGLGIDIEKLRVKIFIYVSLITAVSVSFVGCIGFIGIVGPHIARLIVGEDQRYFISFSVISGMIMLSVADILSKVIKSGAIFPIGIVTAVIGVPFFFLLILSKYKR